MRILMGLALILPFMIAVAISDLQTFKDEKKKILLKLASANQIFESSSSQVENDPEMSHNHNSPRFSRINQYLSEEAFQLAMIELEDELNQYSNCTHTLHLIAQALTGQKNYNEAILVYQNILKINPNQKCCYEHIGNILLAQDKYEEAQKVFLKFSEQNELQNQIEKSKASF